MRLTFCLKFLKMMDWQETQEPYVHHFIDVVFSEIVDSEASNIKSQNAFDTLTINSRKSFSDLSHHLSGALTEIAKNYSDYQKAKANIKYVPKFILEDLTTHLDTKILN